MPNNNYILPQDVDLTNCDREAIHIPGQIQPHGILLALEEPSLRILQASSNTEQLWGVAASALIGQYLDFILASENISTLKYCLEQEDIEANNPLVLQVKLGKQNFTYESIIHRHQGILILELEPISLPERESNLGFYQLIKTALVAIRKARSFSEATKFLAQEVRKITGFDRVMVYRFEPDNSGVVVAEAKRAGLEPYLHLHYPASDIPKQARKLYYNNWLRLIVDINYQPAELIPPHNPLTNEPLDLSHSVLRSVSSLHREYLQNMGVGASCSISLINEQKLWGLIACHHYAPKYIDYESRKACEFLGQLMSVSLVNKQKEDFQVYQQQIKSLQKKFREITSNQDGFHRELLTTSDQSLLELVDAQGSAILLDGNLTLLGQTPQREQVEQLITWLQESAQPEIFFTSCLSKDYPPAAAFIAEASGLLAISLVVKQMSYHLLWFRTEYIHTVDWAGNPDKPVTLDDHGGLTLVPRKSFELWQETVKNQSLPWQQIEIDAAQEFRNTLLLAALKFSQEALEKTVQEAEVANQAKSQFLAKMSHELRTPLNAILGFSQIMNKNDSLSVVQKEHLGIINRSGEHLLTLIDDVLNMSKIEAGRVTLNQNSFDLLRMLHSLEEMVELKADAQRIKLEFSLAADLCRYIHTDESKLRQVLLNLLGNAIKFTHQGQVTLQVENVSPETSSHQLLAFSVTDTGLGIASAELDQLFDPFAQTETGRKSMEGTGLGLPISQQFVRLLGGEIEVSSFVGKGSTFRFVIPVSEVSETEVETTETKEVIALAPGQPQYRILVIEDVPENLQLIREILTPLGFALREAKNGQEGVDVWKTWQPQLILMDMEMPVMNGYEATKRIKSTPEGQDTIIISLTASAFEEQRADILATGCNDFLRKPFQESVLLQKINRYLGVDYLYAEANEQSSNSSSQSLTPQDLQAMPKQWREQLQIAALSMDEEQLWELIEQIPPSEANLVKSLTDLINNFRFDIITEYTEQN
ncbi:MAG: ATP-binding protein [Spirulinaceae cyanobacterium]